VIAEGRGRIDVLVTLFGEGSALTPGQMALRGIVIFFVTLVLIRISGRRSFGRHAPFDACVTVLIGATLARALVGAAPFLATVCAALAPVVMHRLIGLACVRWARVEDVLNGCEIELVHEGRIDERAMRRGLVSHPDLREAIRRARGSEDEGRVVRAVLERNGELTIVLTRPDRAARERIEPPARRDARINRRAGRAAGGVRRWRRRSRARRSASRSSARSRPAARPSGAGSSRGRSRP
jgi:uncharacterized membrane protein YcaP (DUF421 family)